VIAIVPLRAEIARAVDGGVLAARLPEALAIAANEILGSIRTRGREVA